MSRDDALNGLESIGEYVTQCHVDLINKMCDDFEKEKMQMQNQINYWKLSFNKEVEAKRK